MPTSRLVSDLGIRTIVPRITIVSHSRIIRSGLEAVVEAEGGHVVASLETIKALNRVLSAESCDVVLVDISSIEEFGELQACSEFVYALSRMPLVAVDCCGHGSGLLLQLANMGFTGCVSLDGQAEVLPAVLATAAEGGALIHIRSVKRACDLVGQAVSGKGPVTVDCEIQPLY